MLLIQKEKSSIGWKMSEFSGRTVVCQRLAVTRTAAEVYHGRPEVVTRAAGHSPKKVCVMNHLTRNSEVFA
ncbi:hypothetical protein H8F23_14035 [Pseudomonas sp. P155]|uniref:Uncharacterized protein n=1 Tax=Pseudomonas neuropathica TaxID=2730425 RepID=A0ABS0BIS7_9PSED|nr:hypothetical protein [Pseudomonas neuropathica]MBF6034366.1 hypothetical protein [Pseudomonas neuropathica]